MAKVRVRFAPSPTGPLHIGGARSALFNYLLAQRVGGDFIVRIEDTDRERSTPESAENIKDSLRWLGINWNEGIDVGGPHGPYCQSERLRYYQTAAQQLLAEGRAYYCYCSEQDLAAEREKQQQAGQTPQYNGPCRTLTHQEGEAQEKAGIKPTVRLAIPKNKELLFTDLVRGEVCFNSDEIGGDFVIMKSDGLPTYNFAAVVDDNGMQISHVVRAEEHLSNTPRQILLYQALGYPQPQFAHVSLILGADHSKMSKRHGSVSVVNYREQGFLPEAIINFLALLGWSPPGEDEVFTLDQLIRQFSLSRVSKSPAVFDINKLRWLNARYLRALAPAEIAAGLVPFLPDDFSEERKLLVAQTLANHLETFADIKKYLPLFEGDTVIIEDEEAAQILQQDHAPALIKIFTDLVAAIPTAEFSAERLKDTIKQAGKEAEAKGAALFMVLRVAITGSKHGPDIDKLCALMGQDTLLRRLRGEAKLPTAEPAMADSEPEAIAAELLLQNDLAVSVEDFLAGLDDAVLVEAVIPEPEPAPKLEKTTGLRLYNTQSGKKEAFEPLKPGKVGIYCCGPTTYNYIHLGNARPLVVFDTVRRYLLWLGYDLTFVQNFTDVDDKIIQRAQLEGMDPFALAEKYIEAYFADTKPLKILPADVHPKVTQHIPQIITLVEQLIAKGHAYAAGGDVYFQVRSLATYGELSGRDVEEMRSGARVLPGENKQDPLDFALWKAAKPGEPSWDSPWGQGRPGWHIECSAMSSEYLGDTFDIHGGGADLIFPHHENEIAQSKAASGGQGFARYWMHNGFITVNQEKMSKSLGNFFILRDILAKYPGDVVRFYLLNTHYRSPLDFSDDKLEVAAKSLERIRTSQSLLAEALPEAADGEPLFAERIATAKAEFIAAMDDDFNTALAISVIFTFCRDLNSHLSGAIAPVKEDLEAAAALFADFDNVLGMILPPIKEAGSQELVLPLAELIMSVYSQADNGENSNLGAAMRNGLATLGLMADDALPTTAAELLPILAAVTAAGNSSEDLLLNLLLEVRGQVRAAKNWGLADAIRDGLNDLGITIEDTPQGARWKRS